MLRLPVLFFFFSLCVAADTVVLINGDRISGELQKLEQSKLHVKTKYAGAIQIDWKMVERVEADKQFAIETDTGRQLEGRIRSSVMGVEVEGPRQHAVLSPLAIVRIAPPASSERNGLLRRITGNVDAGYSVSRGNARSSQYTLGFRALYRAANWKLQGEQQSMFSDVGDQSVNRHAGNLRGDYALGDRSFAFSLVGLENDDRQKLDLRANIGGGFGYKIWKTRTQELSLLGGSTFVREEFYTLEKNSGEALASLTLDRMQLGRIALTSKLQVLPNLVDTGRVRLTFDGGVRIPVNGHMNYNLRLFNRFDSRPPQEVQRNDYGVVSGFGVSF